MRRVKQNRKRNYAQRVKQTAKKRGPSCGGSEWGSNPPWTLKMPINGFEVREAHRSSLAPPVTPGSLLRSQVLSSAGAPTKPTRY